MEGGGGSSSNNSKAQDVESRPEYEAYKCQEDFTKWSINNIDFYMESRYEPIDITGQGTFGVVVACKDNAAVISSVGDTDGSADEGERYVAIKKIERAFEHGQYAIRTVREIKLQRMLNHENIIPINRLLLPKSRELFNDMQQTNSCYLVQPLMTSDLRAIINSPEELSEEHIQFFMYQIIRGLKYMHSAQIVHRDLKPKNILSNESGDLKICDFGFARHIEKKRANEMSEYVTARWYRAPEILLAYKKYDMSVDMWSCGVIMAELIKRQPILRGTSTDDQMRSILQLVGTPPLYSIKDPEYRHLLANFPSYQGKNFNQLFPNVSYACLDLLKKLLQIDPFVRVTSEQALEHPYFSKLHDPNDEPVCTTLNVNEFEYEMYDLSEKQIKDILYEEILLYNYPQFKASHDEKLSQGQSIYSHILDPDQTPEDE